MTIYGQLNRMTPNHDIYYAYFDENYFIIKMKKSILTHIIINQPFSDKMKVVLEVELINCTLRSS